jgi:hypothetical protein
VCRRPSRQPTVLNRFALLMFEDKDRTVAPAKKAMPTIKAAVAGGLICKALDGLEFGRVRPLVIPSVPVAMVFAKEISHHARVGVAGVVQAR